MMPTTQNDRETAVQDHAERAVDEHREKLRADAGRQQETCARGHANEELHLVVKHAAVVEQADGGEQRGAGKNARDLLLRRAAQRKNDGKDKAKIDGDAAEERNRFEVNFARPGAIDHAVVERKAANGNGETQRSEKRDRECDQIGVGRHGLLKIVSAEKRRSRVTFRST